MPCIFKCQNWTHVEEQMERAAAGESYMFLLLALLLRHDYLKTESSLKVKFNRT